MAGEVADDAGGVDEAGLFLAGVAVADEFHAFVLGLVYRVGRDEERDGSARAVLHVRHAAVDDGEGAGHEGGFIGGKVDEARPPPRRCRAGPSAGGRRRPCGRSRNRPWPACARTATASRWCPGRWRCSGCLFHVIGRDGLGETDNGGLRGAVDEAVRHARHRRGDRGHVDDRTAAGRSSGACRASSAAAAWIATYIARTFRFKLKSQSCGVQSSTEPWCTNPAQLNSTSSAGSSSIVAPHGRRRRARRARRAVDVRARRRTCSSSFGVHVRRVHRRAFRRHLHGAARSPCPGRRPSPSAVLPASRPDIGVSSRQAGSERVTK